MHKFHLQLVTENNSSGPGFILRCSSVMNKAGPTVGIPFFLARSKVGRSCFTEFLSKLTFNLRSYKESARNEPENISANS